MPHSKPNQSIEEVLAEFDERFKEEEIDGQSFLELQIAHDIKSFLKEKLFSQREEMIKRVEKIPAALRSELESGESIVCRDDVLDLLKEDKIN